MGEFMNLRDKSAQQGRFRCVLWEQKRESVVSMSQTTSNFQSDAFGLTVRRDGLQNNVHSRYTHPQAFGHLTMYHVLSNVVAGTEKPSRNRSRQPKQPFSLAQTTVRVYAKAITGVFEGGHCWGGVGAQFLANYAPSDFLCAKVFSEKRGAGGYVFFSIMV